MWTAVILSTVRVLLSYNIAYRSVTSLQVWCDVRKINFT